MTLAEFKAWFEGFTESLDGAPSEKQWKRIKARVAEIDGTPITETVFIYRFVEPYHRYYDRALWGTACAGGVSAAQCANAAGLNAGQSVSLVGMMSDAGRAEARALS